MNVGFISLGCSKNLIDTEATIGMFKKHNFKVVNNEEKADDSGNCIASSVYRRIFWSKGV